eukprot:3084638-Amphidinium_carterae.2
MHHHASTIVIPPQECRNQTSALFTAAVCNQCYQCYQCAQCYQCYQSVLSAGSVKGCLINTCRSSCAIRDWV